MNGCLIVSRSLVFDYEPCFPVSSFGYHSTVQEDSISWALAYFSDWSRGFLHAFSLPRETL